MGLTDEGDKDPVPLWLSAGSRIGISVLNHSVFRNIPVYRMPHSANISKIIQSFADEITKALWQRIPIKRLPVDLQNQAYKRLSYLNAATRIEDLYQPPSNHFHAIGRRYAIRVNVQWRITFAWTQTGPADVRFEDYHGCSESHEPTKT